MNIGRFQSNKQKENIKGGPDSRVPHVSGSPAPSSTPASPVLPARPAVAMAGARPGRLAAARRWPLPAVAGRRHGPAGPRPGKPGSRGARVGAAQAAQRRCGAAHDRSGRHGAGWRRSGARTRPGWPGYGGARGGATLARAGTTRGGARRPWRHDGITTPAVGDSRGKAV